MLSPYRVLDLSDERGLLCGQIMADLGADVISIEPPGGSSSRAIGPFFGEPHPDRSLFWWAYNRNKRSVVLQLEDPEDRREFLRLVDGADFLIESGRPGQMARLGLGFDDLAPINPSLIYVSVTAFGQEGPKAGYAATELTVWAAAGPLAMAGDEDRPPVRVSVPQAFLFAGAEAAGAALIAHEERVKSGRGQHVDVSAQLAATSATQAYTLASALGDTEMQRMAGGSRVGRYKFRSLWPASDGFVAILFLWGTAIGPFSRRLMEWVFEEGFCDKSTRDKDWINYTTLLRRREEPIEEYERVKTCIENFTRTRTKAELLAGALDRRLLIAPVSTISDVVESQQLAARNYWRDVRHPNLARSVRYPGPFARLSAKPIEYRSPAPTVGQHTKAVLEESRQSAVDRYRGYNTGDVLPLTGLRVLDFFWVVAGPAATRNLADYGATVVRIESSKRVEAARTIGPSVGGEPGTENSGVFSSVNAGKFGLTVDPSHPLGREVVLDLVRWADVVTESFTPKAMRAWGLDYEALRRVRPDIIMLSSCLMGQSGPLAMFAGFGNLAAALAGFVNVAGWPDRAPAGPFGAYTDYVTPRFILPTLLAALDHRRRTGEGQYVDLSQFEAGCHFLAPAILDYTVNGHVTERKGNDDDHMAPHGVYRTLGEDQWVAIAAADDDQWRALCTAMNREDLASTRKLATLGGRLDHRALLDTAVEDWSKRKEGSEIEERLQAAGVAAHVVQNSASCNADPQLEHYKFFPRPRHPLHGPIAIEGTRFRLSRTPARIDTCGPTLGQHNFEVLSDFLGYDAARITELAAAGALD